MKIGVNSKNLVRSAVVFKIIELFLLLSYSKNWGITAFARSASKNPHATLFKRNLEDKVFKSPKTFQSQTRIGAVHFFSKSRLAMISNPEDKGITPASKSTVSIVNPPTARRDENDKVYAGNDPNTSFYASQ